jgi:hypothetical protein
MAAALDGMRKCTLLPDFDAKAAAAAEFQAEDGTAEGADGSEESGENSGEALAEPEPGSAANVAVDAAATQADTNAGSVVNYGYKRTTPAAIVSQWHEIEGYIWCQQELCVIRWFSYLSRCPRIFPLPRADADAARAAGIQNHGDFQLPTELTTLISRGIPSAWACKPHEAMRETLIDRQAEDLVLLRKKLWYELSGGRDLMTTSKISYPDMAGCRARHFPVN